MSRPRNDTPLWVKALLDTSLSPVECRVLMYLVWRQGGNGSAWPSQETIATELALRPDSIRKIVKRLERAGWLAVEWPNGPGRGEKHCKRYTVICPKKTQTAVPLLSTENPASHAEKTQPAVCAIKEEHLQEHIQEEARTGAVPLAPVRKPKRPAFIPPTVDEVAAYAESRGDPDFPAQRFVDYYSERSWHYQGGKTPMKDWRAAVRTWISRDNAERVKRGEPPHDGYSRFGTHPATKDDIRQLVEAGVYPQEVLQG